MRNSVSSVASATFNWNEKIALIGSLIVSMFHFPLFTIRILQWQSLTYLIITHPHPPHAHTFNVTSTCQRYVKKSSATTQMYILFEATLSIQMFSNSGIYSQLYLVNAQCPQQCELQRTLQHLIEDTILVPSYKSTEMNGSVCNVVRFESFRMWKPQACQRQRMALKWNEGKKRGSILNNRMKSGKYHLFTVFIQHFFVPFGF